MCKQPQGQADSKPVAKCLNGQSFYCIGLLGTTINGGKVNEIEKKIGGPFPGKKINVHLQKNFRRGSHMGKIISDFSSTPIPRAINGRPLALLEFPKQKREELGSCPSQCIHQHTVVFNNSFLSFGFLFCVFLGPSLFVTKLQF